MRLVGMLFILAGIVVIWLLGYKGEDPQQAFSQLKKDWGL